MRTKGPDTFAGGGKYRIIDAVDDEDAWNALLESNQEFITTTFEFEVDGYIFKLTRHEPNKKRTYKDSQENDVHYPEMLMVHGFVSDESYFGGVNDGRLTEQICRLGLTVNTLTLPDGMGHLSAEEILEIQARGVQAAYNSLSTGKAKGSEVILTAHSRGAIVATHAAYLLKKEHAEHDNLTQEEQAKSAKPLKGLVLLAPAGLHDIGSGSILSASLKIPDLAKKSIGDIRSHPRSTFAHLGMVARSLVSDPMMRLKEAVIAASSDIKPILSELSNSMSILIIAAENDAFVDHKKLYEFVKENCSIKCEITIDENTTHDNEPTDSSCDLDANNGISLLTIKGLTHMLLDKKYKSGADPRGLPGILLQFFQSRMPDPKDGKRNGHSPISYKAGNKVDGVIPKPSRL